MPGLFTCRVCGADSPYEVCNACVPPLIRSRRAYEAAKQSGRKATQEDYYQYLHRSRPLPTRLYDPETPLEEEG